MTVKDIVADTLKSNGFDGLCHPGKWEAHIFLDAERSVPRSSGNVQYAGLCERTVNWEGDDDDLEIVL